MKSIKKLHIVKLSVVSKIWMKQEAEEASYVLLLQW
jgi:hypothetical protein